MINTSVCPMCQQPVLANGYVSCNNIDCTEHGIKYLHYEFVELINDLAELELLEGDHINGQAN